MHATLESIEHDAMALPPDQRARLVDKLWDSLGDTTYSHLSEACRAEIEHRRQEISQGKAKSVPGEEVSRKAWRLVEGTGS
jgi:putative addiction module component (TIGR02574 family)